MPDAQLDLLQGTLDLLILRTLATGPMHGWAISQRIQQVSQDVLRVNQGSLYPALHRLEEAGAIAAEWGRSPEHNRQARFYRLTPAGARGTVKARAPPVGTHGGGGWPHSGRRGVMRVPMPVDGGTPWSHVSF